TSGTGFVTSREADASSSHAEGVAVLFLAAALVATRRCLGGTSGKAFKSPPKVLKVVVADFEFFHFVDDRLEVREGTHGSQGRSVGGTQHPSCRGEDQCIFDGLQRDRPVV